MANRRIYVVIEERNSAWGKEIVEFELDDQLDENDLFNALKEAREELQDDTSLVEEDDCSEVITMKIVERASEILDAKARYVDMVEFEYEYDWNYWEENHKEEEV